MMGYCVREFLLEFFLSSFFRFFLLLFSYKEFFSCRFDTLLMKLSYSETPSIALMVTGNTSARFRMEKVRHQVSYSLRQLKKLAIGDAFGILPRDIFLALGVFSQAQKGLDHRCQAGRPLVPGPELTSS